MTTPSRWNDLAAQQLVRYEALFGLLDDIQSLEDVAAIGTRVATQWKYLANVASWRLVVTAGESFQIVDGFRGQARITTVEHLSGWDLEHWTAKRPLLLRVGARQDGGTPEPSDPGPPEHLAAPVCFEIEVLPVFRGDRCVGLLTVGSRRTPFTELDRRFIRLFGRHLADRVSSILLQRQITETLLSKATRDELTGLLNRGAVIDQLARQVALSERTGAPVSVALIDVDLFKIVNDTYGHLVGDAVLREVSRRLQAQLRDSDALGRYGGEEFLCVLYPCPADEAVAVAERLRRAIADRPMSMGPGQDRIVTVSLGTCSSERVADPSLEGLLKSADDALYRSKAGGRNRVTSASSP